MLDIRYIQENYGLPIMDSKSGKRSYPSPKRQPTKTRSWGLGSEIISASRRSDPSSHGQAPGDSKRTHHTVKLLTVNKSPINIATVREDWK